MSDTGRLADTEVATEIELEALLDVISYGVVVLTPSLEIRRCNRRVDEIWGLPAGSSVEGVRFVDFTSRVGCKLREPSPAIFVLDPSSTPRSASTTTERLELDDGRVIEVQRRSLTDGGRLLTFQDVSPVPEQESTWERRLHEAMEATARAEARLSYAMENIDQGVVLYDEHWRVSAWNQKWVELLGFSKSFLAERPTLEQIIRDEVERGIDADLGGDTEDKVKAWLAPVMAAEGPYLSDQHLADGTVIELWTNPLPSGGLIRVLSDVTARREAEAELRIAKQLAENATSMKSRFLASMSHELRTPLNAIIGITDMLYEDALEVQPPESDELEALGRVSNAGKHLLALINDILDLTRMEAGKLDLAPRPVVVRDLVAETTDTVRPLASRNDNVLRVDVGEDCGTIIADPVRVRQIVLNLLSNACKFTENGRVSLTARRTSENGRELLIFDIDDTGIGIATEQAETLFEEFAQGVQTPASASGVGLGLAISHRLALMMGGGDPFPE